MKIGNTDLGDRPLLLAPMEDVTDIGFRKLCKRYGAAMMYTEFVAADAIIRAIPSTLKKMVIDDTERPVGIQIYGKSVESMVEAAKIVEQFKPDVIDLNFGCPVKKVAGKGAGSGLLKNIPLMLDITREVVKAQMYTGEADWTLIGEVKRNPRIHIPIIGNGDITTPQQAKQAFERFGVDAVMVGRATFGQPWVFKDMKDYLIGKDEQQLSIDEKIDILEEQLKINVERIDEYRGILHTRRHLAASPIFKNIPNFKQTRIAMLRAETVKDITNILNSCRLTLNELQSY